jgi:hypothetical protein
MGWWRRRFSRFASENRRLWSANLPESAPNLKKAVQQLLTMPILTIAGSKALL